MPHRSSCGHDLPNGPGVITKSEACNANTGTNVMRIVTACLLELPGRSRFQAYILLLHPLSRKQNLRRVDLILKHLVDSIVNRRKRLLASLIESKRITDLARCAREYRTGGPTTTALSVATMPKAESHAVDRRSIRRAGPGITPKGAFLSRTSVQHRSTDEINAILVAAKTPVE